MNSLRVGGIASGLDTNAIIDSLMTTAQAPIKTMNLKIDSLTWEQSKYNDLLSDLNDLKESLLNLKLESTFKSKNTTSTASHIAEASSGVSTNPGTYTIKVEQTAKNSYASSVYTNSKISKTGAGVENISTLSKSKYNQIEGLHKVSISNPDTDVWAAKDEFTLNSNLNFTKMSGAVIDNTFVDDNGKLLSSVNENLSFVFSYNGQEYSYNINFNYAAGTSIQKISQDMEEKINSYIDNNITKNGIQTLAIRTDRDDATGKFSFSFYDTTNSTLINIAGFRDTAYNPSDPAATNGSAATALARNLGLYYGEDISTPTVTKTMTNTVISDSKENLAAEINTGSLITGIKFRIGEEGLKEGSFTVNQDSSSNNSIATKSTVAGGSFASIGSASEADIDSWLTKTFGDMGDNNYFDIRPSEAMNGVFHINGKAIEITDYTRITPQQLLGIINGSGAGVTASFDYETKTFKLESNKEGGEKITLGESGDTSNILTMLKLSIPSGGVYTKGSTAGNLDTASTLATSGLTTSPSSGVFSINGVSIYVDTTKDTIESIIKKVNNSGAGVVMSYDTSSDKFYLSGTTSEKITIGNPKDTSNFLEAVNLTYNYKESIEIGSEGQNAIFTVNGAKYVRDTNTVSDAVAGMSITLNDVGTAVINVKIDTDRAVDAMAEFASKYNNLINKLNPTEPTKSERKKYSDVLDDDKKKEMSDEEIADYTKNYYNIQYYDLIHKSSEVRTLKTNLRNYVMEKLNLDNNQFRSLSDLGVTIAGSDIQNIKITKLGFLFDTSTDKEQLAKYIKEKSTFSSVVENNAEDVYNFFTQNKEVKISKKTGKQITDDNSTEDFYKVTYMGWARRYDDFLTKTTSSTSALYKKSGANGTLDTRINSLKTQIEAQTRRAEQYLERMWNEFSNMETRVSELQNSASYITKISGGQNTSS